MYVIKKDHEHVMQCHPKRSQSAKQIEQASPKRPERKIKIKKLFNNNSKQYVYSDALIPDLQQSLTLIQQSIFQFMSSRRKQIQHNVYTGVTQDQSDYLSRLFRGQQVQKPNKYTKLEIEGVIKSSINVICTQIMKDDSLQIKRQKKKIRKEDLMFGGGNPEVVIKLRQRILKSKLSDLRVDMNQSSVKNNSSNMSLDPLSPDLYGKYSAKTKKAQQFVKYMQKLQQDERRQRAKKENEKNQKQKRDEQQKREMQIRLKQQKHQFLKKQYHQKRKQKSQERKEQEKEEQKFKQYLKQHKEKKPLFKKNQEQFFKNFILPENNKKLTILSQIKKQHQPITHQQLLAHQKQYLQIREDNQYQKNAARMMELKARKPIPKYYKSKHHSEIQRQFNTQMQDPSQRITQLYEKRLQYSTEIKSKFAPKVSFKKRNQWIQKLQQEKKKQKSRATTNDYRKDGKNNLDRLHKYIAQLKAKGKTREVNTSQTIQYTTKPNYKNYLKQIELPKSARHTIDYSSVEDGQYATFQIRKKEEGTTRRQRYLNNIRSMDMDTYMYQKKKLDEDYLQSAKAKIALINKYQ